MLLKTISRTKTVAVWGLGYLGYTTILKLQDSGFFVFGYDFNFTKMSNLLQGNYPSKEQLVSWSRRGFVPRADPQKLEIVTSERKLFSSSDIHMIAIPEHYRGAAKETITGELAKIFADFLKKRSSPPLIIFESAYVPGFIEKHFVEYLKKYHCICDKDYFLGVWLRTDWNIEAFVNQKEKSAVAGFSTKSLSVVKDFLKSLDVATIELDRIKAAEIYINSINAIQAMVNDFIRQLTFGYHSVNIKDVSRLIFENIDFEDCDLNFGTGGTKMTTGVDFLMQGSDEPAYLTLLKEFQDISISSVLNYGEYIIRRGYKNVAILGLTYKGNQKDLMLSPAVTLADHLISNGVRVFLNDPFFSQEEIRKLIKGARVANFPAGVFSTDVTVVASDHNEYKYLTQEKLDKIHKKTKLIIDNYGIWKYLSFGKKSRYHCVGDGSLNLTK